MTDRYDTATGAKIDPWKRIASLEQENKELREQVEGLLGFKRSVDEALNMGDGSYRP